MNGLQLSALAAQLPLALRFPPDQRFETYIAAPEGALAQLHALAQGRGIASSVYLAGAAATGKTHLLLATCAEAEAAGLRTAYLPLAAAAGRLRDALDAFEHADLVALDGLEAIAGDREDEIALFDAHNRARDAGRSLLYAARAMPDALALVLPDLRSRLSQCVRIALEPLDDDGRADVLRVRAQRRGLQLEDTAIDWLLKRVDRDLVSLTALLDRLDRESLAAQRRLTVPFLRSVLGG
ncbi:MAG: DnaA regulatory inactivator Hda [Lysobacteraceae bacterium]